MLTFNVCVQVTILIKGKKNKKKRHILQARRQEMRDIQALLGVEVKYLMNEFWKFIRPFGTHYSFHKESRGV